MASIPYQNFESHYRTQPTTAEFKKIWKRIKKGDNSAKHEIIERLTPYVFVCAGNLLPRGNFTVLEEDLIMEGLCGVYAAIEANNAVINWKCFSAFASKYIKQKITDFIYEKQAFIRLDAQARWEINKMVKAWKAYYVKFGHSPSLNHLAKKLKKSIRNMDTILQYFKAKQNAIAIDDHFMGPEIIEKCNIDEDTTKKYISKAISLLPVREGQIVKWSFELDNQPFLQYSQMTKHTRVVEDMNRRLEIHGLERLRRLLTRIGKFNERD